MQEWHCQRLFNHAIPRVLDAIQKMNGWVYGEATLPVTIKQTKEQQGWVAFVKPAFVVVSSPPPPHGNKWAQEEATILCNKVGDKFVYGAMTPLPIFQFPLTLDKKKKKKSVKIPPPSGPLSIAWTFGKATLSLAFYSSSHGPATRIHGTLYSTPAFTLTSRHPPLIKQSAVVIPDS